jgi:excisionase family DNA binding protein
MARRPEEAHHHQRQKYSDSQGTLELVRGELMTNSDYYTVQELARVLHMHENSIWRKIHNGEIPAVRIGIRGKWLITKRWVESLKQSQHKPMIDICRYRLCKQVTIGDRTEEAQPWCTLQEGWCEHQAGDCPVLKEAGLCSSI